MHIAELFDSFHQTPHVEIVEPELPEARQRILATFEGQIQLSAGHSGRSPFAAQLPRGALFQNLNCDGRGFRDGLADLQMNVFGHDHEPP